MELNSGETEPPLQRSGLHVDELHSPVRDDGQLAEQDPMGDQQVIVPLGVTPGTPVPIDQPQSPGEGDGAESDSNYRDPPIHQHPADTGGNRDQADDPHREQAPPEHGEVGRDALPLLPGR